MRERERERERGIGGGGGGGGSPIGVCLLGSVQVCVRDGGGEEGCVGGFERVCLLLLLLLLAWVASWSRLLLVLIMQ